MPTIHLIDASPYIFRAYFATSRSFLDGDGQDATAVHGFLAFLHRFVREHSPTHLGIAFDESLTTSFRNDVYPAYKAQRELPPPELVSQLRTCFESAGAFGAWGFADSRYEADDIIATVIEQTRSRGVRFVVVSPDKDLAQLVADDVELFDFARDIRLGPEEVRDRFGVQPRQIPDYLGLAGDAVDNIPGVRGIGPKTAATLLSHFGSIDDLYSRLDEVEEIPIRGARSLEKKLEAAREIAFLSRSLATVSTAAPVSVSIRDLEYTGIDRDRSEILFRRLGFEGLRRRILGEPDEAGG